MSRSWICFRSKILVWLLSFLLLVQQTGLAQLAVSLDVAGAMSGLGNMLVADKFRPLHFRYLAYNIPLNKFDLLLDKGDQKNVKSPEIESTAKDLLNYFFIGLTLPNSMFWVNLRPEDKDHSIDPQLARTDIGRILLAADLQLKKDMAKYVSQETPEGREYWTRVYKKAGEIYGNQEIAIPTMTRPWIVPGEIIISENRKEKIESERIRKEKQYAKPLPREAWGGEGGAYIYKATLKVMLQQDHLKNDPDYNFTDPKLKAINEYASQQIRELIIPRLTKEVNTAKRYAQFRQVYYSLILAQWFKKRYKNQSGTYPNLIDQQNLTGLESKTTWSKDTYFSAYKKSFQNGEYNSEKSVDTPDGQTVRTYVSGGFDLTVSSAVYIPNPANVLPISPSVIPIGIRGGLDAEQIPAVSAVSSEVTEMKSSSSPAASWLDKLKSLFRKTINVNKDEESFSGPKPAEVQISSEAFAYEDPELGFSGIDLEHFFHAQQQLSLGMQADHLKQVLTLAGLAPQAYDLDAMNKARREQAFAAAIQDLLKELSGGKYNKAIIDSINQDTYKNPYLKKLTDKQSQKPKTQAIFEAVSNSLDALGCDIGQFGKGVKQILEWLGPSGQDRIEVLTRARDGDYYQLTILKSRSGQNYIQIKAIDRSVFQQAALGENEITQGTVVRVKSQDWAPGKKDADAAFQNTMITELANRFAYVPDVTIYVQGEKLNDFDRKVVLVPHTGKAQRAADAATRRVHIWSHDGEIVIVDNGKGMDAGVLSRMFVKGSKQADELDGAKRDQEAKRISVVFDPLSSKREVSFGRRYEVIKAVQIPDRVLPQAVAEGGLLVDLAGFLDVPEARDEVKLPEEARLEGNFQFAVNRAVQGILTNPDILTPDKIRYINMLVCGLDGLIGENGKHANVIDQIKMEIKKALKPWLKEYQAQGYLLLPYYTDFRKVQIPKGKEDKVIWLHEDLFDSTATFIASQLGGQVIPDKLLKGELSVVVLPFTAESLAAVNGKAVSSEQVDRDLALVRAKDFVAVPSGKGRNSFGQRLFELAKKSTGLNAQERKELAHMWEQINKMTGEALVTGYEMRPGFAEANVIDAPTAAPAKPAWPAVSNAGSIGAAAEQRFREDLSRPPATAFVPGPSQTVVAPFAEGSQAAPADSIFLFSKPSDAPAEDHIEIGIARFIRMEDNYFMRIFSRKVDIYNPAGELLWTVHDCYMVSHTDRFLIVEYVDQAGGKEIIDIRNLPTTRSARKRAWDIQLSASGRFSVQRFKNEIKYCDHDAALPQLTGFTSFREISEYVVHDKADVVIAKQRNNTYGLFSLESGKPLIWNAEHIEIDASGMIAIYKIGNKLGLINLKSGEPVTTRMPDFKEKIFISNDAGFVYVVFEGRDKNEMLTFLRNKNTLVLRQLYNEQSIPEFPSGQASPEFWQGYDISGSNIYQIADRFGLFMIMGTRIHYSSNPPTKQDRTTVELFGNVAVWRNIGNVQGDTLFRNLKSEVEEEQFDCGITTEILPLKGGKSWWVDRKDDSMLVVWDEGTQKFHSVNLSSLSITITKSREFILQGRLAIFDAQGNVREIPQGVPDAFAYVHVNGEYFVFTNASTGQSIYLDPRRTRVRTSALAPPTAIYEEIIRAFYANLSERIRAVSEVPIELPAAAPVEPERREDALWQEKIMSQGEAWIAQARAAYLGFAALVPEECADYQDEINGRIEAGIDRLFAKQTAEIRRRFAAAAQGQELDLTGLPFELFERRMARIMSGLPGYLETVAERLPNVHKTRRAFYTQLFGSLFQMALDEDAATDLSLEAVLALGGGWQMDTVEQVRALEAVIQLIRALTTFTGINTSGLLDAVAFLARFAGNDPVHHIPIMTKQISRILTAEEQSKVNFLKKLCSSFQTVGIRLLLAYADDPLAGHDMGYARPVVAFLTQEIDELPHRGQPVLPNGEDVLLADGTGHYPQGIDLSRLNDLERRRPKNGQPVIAMDDLIAAIQDPAVSLPETDPQSEKDVLFDVKVQGEADAAAREGPANAQDAGAKTLVIDHYLQDNNGEEEYVEAFQDDGPGAAYAAALLIKVSTKEADEQEHSAGFFGKGKYTFLAGVDRVEIITCRQGTGYMFVIQVSKDAFGNPLHVKLTRIRKISDPNVQDGVLIRRIKKAKDTIPEFDAMLSERAYKIFSGLSSTADGPRTSGGFGIYFRRGIDGETHNELLTVDHQVLSETDFKAILAGGKPITRQEFETQLPRPRRWWAGWAPRSWEWSRFAGIMVERGWAYRVGDNEITLREGWDQAEQAIRRTLEKEFPQAWDFLIASQTHTFDGKFKIISARDMPSQVVDKFGRRVCELDEAQYFALVPPALRKHIQQLGLIVQVPLPLTGNRDKFAHFDEHYKSIVQRYVAIEFYKALALRTMMPATAEQGQFTFEGFPVEWEREPREHYSLAIDQHDRAISALANKINAGQFSLISSEELESLPAQYGEKDLVVPNFVKLILMLNVPNPDRPGKTISLFGRRMKLQIEREKQRPSFLGKASKALQRAAEQAGYILEAVPQAEDIADFDEMVSKSIDVTTGIEQISHPEKFMINTSAYTDREKELRDLALSGARHFGIEQVVLLSDLPDESLRFAGAFGYYGPKGQEKPTMFLNRALAGQIGVAGPGVICQATDVIIHELAHLLEESVRTNLDVREQLRRGFVSTDSKSGFTHQPVGPFAQMMKWVACNWFVLEGEDSGIDPARADAAGSPVTTQLGATRRQSSPAPAESAENPGGVDLRELSPFEKGTNSLYGWRKMAAKLPADFNSRDEWAAIQAMLAEGGIPAIRRIANYVAASYQNGRLKKERPAVLGCIADILRLEEDEQSPTDPEMREMLVMLHSE
ncbi:MAG: hypothetical protein HQL23_00250 [Candidatus Omnitrophica bacterium]|nr:hypothetical protein [Candidatus Omnitrophota bacterium]